MIKKIYLSILILILTFSSFVSFKVFADENPSVITYSGSTNFYKNATSILLLNQICEFVRPNFICEDEFGLSVTTDNYTGHGATIGNYDIIIKATSENQAVLEKTITINVVSGVNCEYMYKNDFYIYKNSNMTKQNLIENCKKLGLIPDVPCNSNITSEYFSKTEISGFYLFTITYLSATGYSGELTGRIINQELPNMELIDVVQIKSESNYEWLNTVLILLAIGVVTLIIIEIFRKTKKKRRTF